MPRTIADNAEIYRIYFECPGQSGAAKVTQQRDTLNWAVTRRPIGVVDSMINRARIGLWDSKLSTDFSIGALTR